MSNSVLEMTQCGAVLVLSKGKMSVGLGGVGMVSTRWTMLSQPILLGMVSVYSPGVL